MRYLTLIFALLSTPVHAASADLLIAILDCESSGKHDARGDSGRSYGIAQFQKPTFDRFTKLAGVKGYQYRNPIHQLKLMNWAIDHGHGEHWTCYSKLAGKNASVMDSIR